MVSGNLGFLEALREIGSLIECGEKMEGVLVCLYNDLTEKQLRKEGF